MTPNATSPLVDFNGDGKSDILWRNSQTGENQVWFMDGAALLSSAPLPAQPDLNWHLAVVADVNRDAKPDLVWRNYQTGENLVWVMNGAQFISTMQLPTVADSFWALSGAADFNGDGQTDFLWRNYRTGEIQIWLMNGANLASTVALKTIADTKWTIEGTADLNGDGRPDILWRNFWTGENAFWLMDGTALVSDSDLPKLEDPNWRMTGNPYLSADGKPGLVFRNYHTGKNLVWFLDWNGGQPKIATELSLPAATDTAWQIVDPFGCRGDSILSDQEGYILGMEATTLSAGGGGFNAYDASGVSSLYTKSGGFVLSYPPRASTSHIFQFKKVELEKDVTDKRRQLEVQIAMAGGQTMTDPETGRPALFTASGVKEFVFSDDTWP